MDLAGGVAIGLMMQPLKQARDVTRPSPCARPRSGCGAQVPLTCLHHLASQATKKKKRDTPHWRCLPACAINQLVQLGPTLKEYKVPEDGEGGVPRSFLGALGWATSSRQYFFYFYFDRAALCYLSPEPSGLGRVFPRGPCLPR